MSQIHISQLAQLSGVPASTLRYYESIGLLPAARDSTGSRVYSEDSVTRLSFIMAAKHLGLPLDEIRELIVACDKHVLPAARVDLRQQLTTRLGQAELRMRELVTFTDSLRGALKRLGTS